MGMIRNPIIVIGKGHSGTRMISKTLKKSGVCMGRCNSSGDYIGKHRLMYKTARACSRMSTYLGNYRWDFQAIRNSGRPDIFHRMVDRYLKPLLLRSNRLIGWKLPETTLAYPWIADRFPDARFIYITRDPRDAILKGHMTDNLERFGIPFDEPNSGRRSTLARAVSWKYQSDLIDDTPKPSNFLSIRFEDFILDQEDILKEIEDFVGKKMETIIVRPESIGRWKDKGDPTVGFSFLPDYGFDP